LEVTHLVPLCQGTKRPPDPSANIASVAADTRQTREAPDVVGLAQPVATTG